MAPVIVRGDNRQAQPNGEELLREKERAAEAAQVAEEETIPATNGILIS